MRILGRMPKKGVGQGKGGGPKTQAGKKNSSKNATKHGLCGSRKIVLSDERQEDRDAVERGWREEFQPEGYAEDKLVGELIDSDWGLIRARRRVAWAEEQAVKDWTEESRHHLELMHRYLTAAERSFHRAWNAVQALRKDRLKTWEKEHKIQETLRELKGEVQELKKKIGPVAVDFDATKKKPYGPFGPNAPHEKQVEKTCGDRYRRADSKRD